MLQALLSPPVLQGFMSLLILTGAASQHGHLMYTVKVVSCTKLILFSLLFHGFRAFRLLPMKFFSEHSLTLHVD